MYNQEEYKQVIEQQQLEVNQYYNMNDIIYEDLGDKNKKYAYGMYGDFKAIIMKENGYINATKLCQLGNKRYDNWLQNEQSQRLIQQVEKYIQQAVPGIPGTAINPIITIKGGNFKRNGINIDPSGTYVHHLIIPHIAAWTSEEFAIKISIITNNYITNQMKNKFEDIEIKLLEKEGIIKEKQDKIDELMNKIDKLQLKSDQQLQKLDKQSEDLQKQSEEIQDQKIQIKELLSLGHKQLSEIKQLNDKVDQIQSYFKDLSSNSVYDVKQHQFNKQNFIMLVKVNKQGNTIKILRTTIESFKKNKSYLLYNYPDIDMTDVFCIPHVGAQQLYTEYIKPKLQDIVIDNKHNLFNITFKQLQLRVSQIIYQYNNKLIQPAKIQDKLQNNNMILNVQTKQPLQIEYSNIPKEVLDEQEMKQKVLEYNELDNIDVDDEAQLQEIEQELDRKVIKKVRAKTAQKVNIKQINDNINENQSIKIIRNKKIIKIQKPQEQPIVQPIVQQPIIEEPKVEVKKRVIRRVIKKEQPEQTKEDIQQDIQQDIQEQPVKKRVIRKKTTNQDN